MSPDDEVYLDWLASSPKGVRWDKAQEMYALYQKRLQEQAEAVAQRLLGKSSRKKCPNCDLVISPEYCGTCLGTGYILNA